MKSRPRCGTTAAPREQLSRNAATSQCMSWSSLFLRRLTGGPMGPMGSLGGMARLGGMGRLEGNGPSGPMGPLGYFRSYSEWMAISSGWSSNDAKAFCGKSVGIQCLDHFLDKGGRFDLGVWVSPALGGLMNLCIYSFIGPAGFWIMHPTLQVSQTYCKTAIFVTFC